MAVRGRPCTGRLSGDGRRRRSRRARRRGRPARRSTVRSAWRCGRRGRSPCRGRRGAPAPRGCEPRRSCLSRTATSSGCSTMPRTRCSSASASTAQASASSVPSAAGWLSAAGLGLGGRWPRPRVPRRPVPRRPRRPRQRRLGWPRRPSSRRPSWRRRRVGLGLAAGLLERLVEDARLVALRLGDPQGALGARQALELLPVTGDLEDRRDGLGRLRADAEPVLRPLGVDLDERGLLLGVVLADLLDDAPSRLVRESATTMR